MVVTTSPNPSTAPRATKHRSFRRARLSTQLIGAVLALSACSNGGIVTGDARTPTPGPSGIEAPAPTGEDIVLAFEGLGAQEVSTEALVATAAVKAKVIRRGSGQLRAVSEPTGASGVTFPSQRAADQGNLAAIRLASTSGLFDVEDRDFSFGADVWLSAQAQGSEQDNGDNVFQRGLFGSNGQYKVQLDNGRPSCRVSGQLGSVIAKADMTVEPERWYRLACRRANNAVTLFVAPVTSGQLLEPKEWTVVRASGRTGAVRFGAEDEFLSIGAKINRKGNIVRNSPDQFNGSIDRVFFINGD